VDILGSFASIFTIFGGILFLQDMNMTSLGQVSEIEDNFKLFVFVLVFLINFAFWSHWLYHFA
jgi:hypothetical protein